LLSSQQFRAGVLLIEENKALYGQKWGQNPHLRRFRRRKAGTSLPSRPAPAGDHSSLRSANPDSPDIHSPNVTSNLVPAPPLERFLQDGVSNRCSKRSAGRNGGRNQRSPTLTPLAVIFCAQVLVYQYFSQINPDRPARNLFKTEILQNRSAFFFNPDHGISSGHAASKNLRRPAKTVAEWARGNWSLWGYVCPTGRPAWLFF
jgi:hypothetical protein